MLNFTEYLKEESSNKQTVYIDMDGVIADFAKKYNETFDIKLDEIVKDPKKFKEIKKELYNTNFFADLEKMDGIKLIDDAKALGYNVEILTSVGKIESSKVVKLKQAWIKKNVKGKIKFNYTTGSKLKAKFANKNSILIDDRIKSIEPFKSAGGKTILYKNYNQAKSELIKLSSKDLNEALITFNKKSYPKSDNVVIIAGGSGSGKGFVIKNLLGIQGKQINVDNAKEALFNKSRIHPKLEALLKNNGFDVSKRSLKNAKDVSDLHELFKKLKINEKIQKNFISSFSNKNKPNIIFDVTLKSLSKLDELKKIAIDNGYDNNKIHIVWVLNAIDIALLNNNKRGRYVNKDILLNTHSGAAKTMKDIINNSSVGGDVWISFNLEGVDTAQPGDKGEKDKKSKFGGTYISRANLVKIKSAGKPGLRVNEIADEIIEKIRNYIPSDVEFK